jgi:ATP-binding cassette subfamily B protein
MKRLLVPVVRQSMATSSGAAALSSVCQGFGMTVTEAEIFRNCGGSESGICIDDLESEARGLGFACEQLVLPIDHLLASDTDIPSIAVTRSADGLLGSVVVWQQLCGLVQLMDPQSGRRWMSKGKLIERLYRHTQSAEATLLSEWMRTPAFQRPLELRIQQLHIPDAHTLVANATCEPGWRGIAALDAVVRQVASRANRRGQAGPGNRSMVLKNWKEALRNSELIPDNFWFARGRADGAVWISGAVILRIRPQLEQ